MQFCSNQELMVPLSLVPPLTVQSSNTELKESEVIWPCLYMEARMARGSRTRWRILRSVLRSASRRKASTCSPVILMVLMTTLDSWLQENTFLLFLVMNLSLVRILTPLLSQLNSDLSLWVNILQ